MRRVGELIRDKRLKFKKGLQKKFIRKIKQKSGLTWNLMSNNLNISEHTLRVDWQKERSTLPYTVVIQLLTKYPFEKWENIKAKWVEEILPKNWGQKLGAINSGNKKSINFPKESEEFAEILGVILGDGHLDKRVLTITGNALEFHHYNYLRNLIKGLFGLESKIFILTTQPNTIILRVYSTELIKYLQINGMKIGNKIKNKASFPKWVFKKNEFIYAALRGLFDTDGGIYYKQKKYKRALIEFQNKSYYIKKNIIFLLKKTDFNPSESLNKRSFQPTKKCYYIRIQNQKEIAKFFRLIGSSNPKNIVRYKYFINKGYIPHKEHLKTKIMNFKGKVPFKMQP